MPAAKQQFFTSGDEDAFSAILREKFPNVTFACMDLASSDGWSEGHDINSFPNYDQIDIFLKPRSWRPNVTRRAYREKVAFYPDNMPDEMMLYQRSNFGIEKDEDGAPLSLGFGKIQVGVTNVMSKAQVSLRGKVWRLLNMIGTNKLIGQFGREGKEVWQECTDGVFFRWFRRRSMSATRPKATFPCQRQIPAA